MLVTLILPNGYQFCKTIWLEFLSYDHRWFLTGFWFPELPDLAYFPDSKLCLILLKIEHIIQLNTRISKMEFANHFSKNHALVLAYTIIFGFQVQNTVDVSSLEVRKMSDSSDLKEFSKKWTNWLLIQQYFEPDTQKW